MSETITITNEDILQQVKISLEILDISERIVTRKIFTKAALEVDITVTTEELQKAADTIRSLKQLHSAKDTLAWLEKNCLSIDDLETAAYLNAIKQKFIADRFTDKVEPYFYENHLDYAGVVMYEVVLDDEDLAIELFYEIREGETSFYDIAHKYIQDTELRRQGGYRGILSRKDLKPEISAAVFATTPPQVLKPILTSKGVHLILVEEIIQPKLDNNLRYRIADELFTGWLNKQAKSVEVAILPLPEIIGLLP